MRVELGTNLIGGQPMSPGQHEGDPPPRSWGTLVEEPEVLRFFYGRLAPTSDWQEKLVAKFREDFGDNL